MIETLQVQAVPKDASSAQPPKTSLSWFLVPVFCLFCILLIGCSSPSIAIPTFLVNSGQKLPISAQAVIAGHTIELEVARTRQQQATGLMYRTSLADNRGMLFTFEPAQTVNFWMKNVRIPLDMLFIRDGQVKAIKAAAPPCEQEPCPTYGPETAVNQVIELRGGRAKELGLKAGDRVELKFLPPQNYQS